MQARGGQITITEKTSGAQWGMQLPRHRTDGDNVVAATRPTRPTTR
jgi:hypothetical protein